MSDLAGVENAERDGEFLGAETLSRGLRPLSSTAVELPTTRAKLPKLALQERIFGRRLSARIWRKHGATKHAHVTLAH